MKSESFVESFDSKGEVRMKKPNLNMNIVVTSQRSKIVLPQLAQAYTEVQACYADILNKDHIRHN